MIFPKITIVTPSYNQGQYLEQTICSVLDQNYPNLEYFVMDGGSQDESLSIIKKHEKYLAGWVSEADKGQSDAINKGLQHMAGDIVNWLNSDDYYQPNTLKEVAEYFQDSSIQVVAGRSRLFQGERTINFSNGTDVYPDNLAKTIGWARIDQPETFFRTSAIRKIGFLNSNLHFVMDRDWWVRVLFEYGLEAVKKVDAVWVNFRLHEDSKTVSQTEKFDKEWDTYFWKIAQEYQFSELAKTLEKGNSISSNLELDIPQHWDRKLVEQALYYFLLQRADQFYYTNQRKKAGVLLKVINKQKLKQEDQSLLKKLQFRNRFLPEFMRKLR